MTWTDDEMARIKKPLKNAQKAFATNTWSV